MPQPLSPKCHPAVLAAFALICAGTAAHAATFQTVYSFQQFEGGYSLAPVIYARNALWGTNSHYGTGPMSEDGTVFAVPDGGGSATIYPFMARNDPSYDLGFEPTAGLVQRGGALYGTTEWGGDDNLGTLFKITSNGKKIKLASFSATTGTHPSASMINLNGNLYGVTGGGGSGSGGTVFAVDRNDQISVIYAFDAAQSLENGLYPTYSLLAAADVLYGTTPTGGPKNEGTIFSVTQQGVLTTIYAFKTQNDGHYPMGPLVKYQGEFYGATYTGDNQLGTAYSVTKSGHEKVLHVFNGSNEGNGPEGGLTLLNGMFYGTTSIDGAHKEGTLFRMTPAGIVTVLHAFTGKADGGHPVAPLTVFGHTLYGTTPSGGNGYGTVFAYTP